MPTTIRFMVLAAIFSLVAVQPGRTLADPEELHIKPICMTDACRDQEEAEREYRSRVRAARAARVEIETMRLGKGRESDAERLIEMREAAEAAAGVARPLPPKGAKPPAPAKCKVAAATKTYSTFDRELERAQRIERGRFCVSMLGVPSAATCVEKPFTKNTTLWWCTVKVECPAYEYHCSPSATQQ